MLTTIAIAAASGFAGLSIGFAGGNFRLRGRIQGLEKVTGSLGTIVTTELVSKHDVNEAFRQLLQMGEGQGEIVNGSLTRIQAAEARVDAVETLALELGETIQNELVAKNELASAFREISLLEQQREQAMTSNMNNIWREIDDLKRAGFRPGASQVGAFQEGGNGTPTAASVAELNAMVRQQLASLNQRIQQVASPNLAS